MKVGGHYTERDRSTSSGIANMHTCMWSLNNYMTQLFSYDI
jgi:hypothetical protein